MYLLNLSAQLCFIDLYAHILALIYEIFYYNPASYIAWYPLISACIVLYRLIESGRQKSVKMLFQAFEVTRVFIKKLSIYAGLRCFTRCTVKKYNTIFY